jgi:hypothetical protein
MKFTHPLNPLTWLEAVFWPDPPGPPPLRKTLKEEMRRCRTDRLYHQRMAEHHNTQVHMLTNRAERLYQEWKDVEKTERDLQLGEEL